LAFHHIGTTTEDWWVECKILIDVYRFLSAIDRAIKRAMAD